MRNIAINILVLVLTGLFLSGCTENTNGDFYPPNNEWTPIKDEARNEVGIATRCEDNVVCFYYLGNEKIRGSYDFTGNCFINEEIASKYCE